MAVEPKTITVNLTGEGLEVGAGQDEITIDQGDVVQWVFVGLPENTLAFVHFLDEGFERFGPFEYLEPSPAGVLAMGNNGHAMTYTYHVLVLDDEGVLASSSDPLTINNESLVKDITPHAIITYDPNAPQGHRLPVDPEVLALEEGQTAIWFLAPENVPSDHFVTFHFDGFLAKPMVGPFQTFSLSPDLSGSVVARGEVFAGTNTITYFVRLRNAQGEVVAQDDPVIEPVGSPPEG